jgi:hypothetical protein|tara:strand:+ start:1106 stop:1330 length:225 start_codon:yes stop_codon:yes gene_type:complete
MKNSLKEIQKAFGKSIEYRDSTGKLSWGHVCGIDVNATWNQEVGHECSIWLKIDTKGWNASHSRYITINSSQLS